MFLWDDFVQKMKLASIEFDHLKVIQLSQAMLESGRGTSDLFKLHANPYGMKFRSEMAAVATSVSYTDSAGATDNYCKFSTLDKAVEGYWRFIDRPVYSAWRTSSRTPEDYIEFIAYAGYIGGPFTGLPADRKQKDGYIKKVLDLVPEAKTLLGQSVPVTPKIWKKRGVLLEIGHGKTPSGFDPGNVTGSQQEYDLNVIAAQAAKNTIIAAGVPCTVTDFGGVTAVDRKYLYEIGLTANGFDVFCSIHHNSSNPPAQGTEVLVHNKKGDSEDVVLAKLMSAAIASELGIPDRIANGRDPRQSLGVLRGAEDTDVRAAVLAEIYFMEKVTNPKDWSLRGGQAIGRTILKWLSDNN
jgi:N-acetylmuramoyl-L-alanine amidase